MASGIATAPPPADGDRTAKAGPVVQGRYEAFIQERLQFTRRQVRMVDVASGLIILISASLLFFLFVALLDHWVLSHGLNFFARLTLWTLWLAAVGGLAWQYIIPSLLGRINPVYAAQTIEQSRPSLKNSLINFLQLRSDPRGVAPVVFQAMEARAATDLSQVHIEHAVDRGRLLKLSYVMAVSVGAFALYLAISTKSPLISAARVIWPWSGLSAPTRVHIEDVTPGDTVAFTDDRLEISALVSDVRSDEPVTLCWSTADGQTVDQSLQMSRIDEGNRYRCELPPGTGGLQQDMLYHITAGDATTQPFKIEVQTAPTIIVDRLTYRFPSYMARADKQVSGSGEISAYEGTQVTIHARSNLEIKEARIDLNCAGMRTLKMAVDGKTATGMITLAMEPTNPNKPQLDSYQILFTDANGRTVRHRIRYRVEVIPVLPPEVKILEPREKELSLPVNGSARIRVQAVDSEFTLRRVILQGEVQGRNLGLPVLLDRPYTGIYSGEYIFRPAAFQLKPGDRVTYWAEAWNNREPMDKHGESMPHMTFRIVGSDAEGQNNAAQPQRAPADPNDRGEKSSENNGNPQNGQPQGSGDSKDSSGNPDNAAKGDKSPAGDSANKDNANKKDQEHGASEKSNDSKQGEPGNQGQGNDNSGKKGDKSSPDGANGQPNDKNSGDSGDSPKGRTDPENQKSDALKKLIEDYQKKHPESQKPQDQQQPQNASEKKNDSSQGNQNQQDQNQQQSGDKKNSPDNAGDKADQGNQGSGEQKNGKQQSGDQKSGEPKDGAAGQSQPEANTKQNGNSSSDNQGSQAGGKSQQNNASNNSGNSPQNGGANDNSQKPSGSGTQEPKPGGAGQPNDKQPGGPQNPSQGQSGAGGNDEQKKQPGSQAGGENSPGGASQKQEKQPGGLSGGDDKQSAQGGDSPKEKGASPQGGSSSPVGGGEKGEKSKPNQDSGSGSGQSGQKKPDSKDESSSGGGSQGGKQPQPGEGQQSSGGKPSSQSKGGQKGGGQKGGSDQGHEGQKVPDKSGSEPSPSGDSSGAPDPQTDRAAGQPKTSDANSAGQKPQDGQSPGNSEKTNDSKGAQPGDRKGGGGAGGGGDQHSNKNGKGTAGTQSEADQGGSVSPGKGQGETGTKAGNDVKSSDHTGSAKQESGPGKGTKTQTTEQTANDAAQKPQGDSAQNSGNTSEKSAGGQSGGKASENSGTFGSGPPAGGGTTAGSTTGPAASQPDRGADEANKEFSRKQVDLALEHLNDQLKSDKPEVLDRLGWSKQEAKKFLENMQKLKDSAEKPGADNANGKKAYNELLKDLDLRPRGTQIRGGQTSTDQLRGLRDASQVEPPGEWAESLHKYSRSTAGEK